MTIVRDPFRFCIHAEIVAGTVVALIILYFIAYLVARFVKRASVTWVQIIITLGPAVLLHGLLPLELSLPLSALSAGWSRETESHAAAIPHFAGERIDIERRARPDELIAQARYQAATFALVVILSISIGFALPSPIAPRGDGTETHCVVIFQTGAAVPVGIGVGLVCGAVAVLVPFARIHATRWSSDALGQAAVLLQYWAWQRTVGLVSIVASSPSSSVSPLDQTWTLVVWQACALIGAVSTTVVCFRAAVSARRSEDGPTLATPGKEGIAVRIALGALLAGPVNRGGLLDARRDPLQCILVAIAWITATALYLLHSRRRRRRRQRQDADTMATAERERALLERFRVWSLCF
jgi:hypothetical protein